MFRRREKEQTPASTVLPTEGREFSYRYGVEQDSDERTSRAEGRYLVGTETGTDYNITELTMGRTVTMRKGERITVEDVAESLAALTNWVARQSSGEMSRIGKYLVEYPRASLEEPMNAVVVAAQNGALRLYELKEVGDTVIVTGRPDYFDDDTVITAPKGARITASVRGRELAGDSPIVNQGKPPYEEKLMTEIHGAIVDYDRQYPIE
jgi:hypothetical protein